MEEEGWKSGEGQEESGVKGKRGRRKEGEGGETNCRAHQRKALNEGEQEESKKVESLLKPGIVLLTPTKTSSTLFLTLSPRALPTCAMHIDTLVY